MGFRWTGTVAPDRKKVESAGRWALATPNIPAKHRTKRKNRIPELTNIVGILAGQTEKTTEKPAAAIKICENKIRFQPFLPQKSLLKKEIAMRTILGLVLLITFLSCEKEVDPDCVEDPSLPPVLCTYELNPVCGCNGKTYANPCTARASGIKRYTSGACKKR